MCVRAHHGGCSGDSVDHGRAGLASAAHNVRVEVVHEFGNVFRSFAGYVVGEYDVNIMQLFHGHALPIVHDELTRELDAIVELHGGHFE